VIFTAKISLTIDSSLGRFERALARWKVLWAKHIEQAPLGLRRGKGAMRSALEMWWLAQLFLRLREGKKIDFGTREDLYTMLKDIQGAQ